MAKTEFQGLTQRTRKLLAGNESLFVDFKRDTNGVKSSDFVAFANAENGGTLLIGIDEYTDDSGLQRGKIVGCHIDDNARLALVNKALECKPSIEIDLSVENIKRQPIIRIDILANQKRPFCNSRGEYTIRADGRNRALFPSELLEIFLESETERFFNRFQKVALELEKHVKNINQVLDQDLGQVNSRITWFESQLHTAFSRIGQLMDSSKKRSRALLNTMKGNQESLLYLEKTIAEDINDEAYADYFEQLSTKLDRLIVLSEKLEVNK